MCTIIVTNSYSCGIGEQNQNALMMENNENQKNMKILNVILKGEELLSSETANITGGADMETNTNEAAICLCTNDKQDNTNDATWVCIC